MFSLFEKILEPELDGSARTRNHPMAGWGEATRLPSVMRGRMISVRMLVLGGTRFVGYG